MDDFLLSRLASAIKRSVARMNLNLNGLVVVTECATGVYSCTPAIAALAGASKVVAFGKDSSFGTFEAAREDVHCLWRELGLSLDVLLASDSMDILHENLRKADIVSNSGHLRPLDRKKLMLMKTGTVIPLMFEAWEFRDHDIDLEICQRRHILVFEYFGVGPS